MCPAEDINVCLPDGTRSGEDRVRRMVAAIGCGDEAAFDHFHDLYHQRVFGLALTLTSGNHHVAHELVQLVMITAATKLRNIDGEAHLWNWLALVTRRHHAKLLRAGHRDAGFVDLDSLPEPTAPEVVESALAARLDAALATLRPVERQLVELYYYEAHSQQQLAARRGVTIKAIERQLERVRAKLRRWIVRKSQT